MKRYWVEIDEEVLGRLKDYAEPITDTPNAALRKALGMTPSEHEHPAELLHSVDAGPSRPRRRRKPGGYDRLPVSEFRLPLLRALAARGGEARRPEIMAAVLDVVGDRLGAFDLEMLDGNVARWETRLDNVRLELRKGGFLKDGLPMGLWGMTEAGFKELRRLEAEAEDREPERAR